MTKPREKAREEVPPEIRYTLSRMWRGYITTHRT